MLLLEKLCFSCSTRSSTRFTCGYTPASGESSWTNPTKLDDTGLCWRGVQLWYHGQEYEGTHRALCLCSKTQDETHQNRAAVFRYLEEMDRPRVQPRCVAPFFSLVTIMVESLSARHLTGTVNSPLKHLINHFPSEYLPPLPTIHLG